MAERCWFEVASSYRAQNLNRETLPSKSKPVLPLTPQHMWHKTKYRSSLVQVTMYVGLVIHLLSGGAL